MSEGRRLAYWLAGFIAFAVVLYLLRGMLLPFVVGMAIAYFLDPTADRLERWGLSRTLAVTIITALFFIIVAGLLALLVPIIQSQFLDLAARMPAYAEFISRQLDEFLTAGYALVPPDDVARIREAVGTHAGELIAWVGRALASVWRGGLALFSILSLVIITPIVTFYLLRDWDRIVARVDSWLPRSQADVIRGQVRAIDRTLSGFVRGQGLVCLILGAFYGIGLSLAGLDFGLVVGLGAGAISFIPFVGSIVGLVASVGLAFLQFSEWQPIAIVAGIFAVGQILEGNFLTPRLVGDRVGLHPVWIMFALLAGGALLGFLGVVLAIPIAATTGVLVRFGVKRYLASPLYHGDESPPPAEPRANDREVP